MSFTITRHLLPPGFIGNLHHDETAPRFEYRPDQPIKLMWLDLETTGLNTEKDHILEIAVRFTNMDGIFSPERAEWRNGFTTPCAPPSEVLDRISDPWILNQHEDLLRLARDPMLSLPYYSLDLVLSSWLKYFGSTAEKPTIHLAGNSVWFDRAFITRLLPASFRLLHYRQIDVTSIQENLTHLFAHRPEDIQFLKKKAHRALSDVEESMRQYVFYRRFLKALEMGPPQAPAPDASKADDLRAKGWSVAVHNDYRLDGVAHTFWLFTKNNVCFKGEGLNDAQALDEVRLQIAAFEKNS